MVKSFNKIYVFSKHFVSFFPVIFGFHLSFFSKLDVDFLFKKYGHLFKFRYQLYFFFSNLRYRFLYYRNYANRFHFMLIKNAKLLKNWFINFRLPLRGQRTKTNRATARKLVYKFRTYERLENFEILELVHTFKL